MSITMGKFIVILPDPNPCMGIRASFDSHSKAIDYVRPWAFHYPKVEILNTSTGIVQMLRFGKHAGYYATPGGPEVPADCYMDNGWPDLAKAFTYED